ncbi:hypothetical protein HS088_TW20G00077 [Tripterygium wilfordii]|uniref:RING-type E3 ubiquitin transferase n=1 Tax=Tripterygium wilfordii TaxID=458696 RepID=A0A7J7C6D0_TRIWF|nr:RING-H2 finger protein ATL52-like [Tripterygium wilfordii]KAF5729713.1 hypothetical protein HS088_TW20G00077 [Tripterygium wilfordii]
MGSLESPKTWIPYNYANSKDCSQGFCSIYCPQWCYITFPPPPPIEFPDDDSSPTFSPLVIAIIGILASAFLLVSYYTIISKYCGDRGRTRRENEGESEGLGESHNPSIHEPWHAPTSGLDESLIKSITVCKYKKGDGLIEGTDCSVCLSEFEEDESVRLLPKCSHAFHVPCIDTWLKSHSNCPLCRANIVLIGASSSPLTTTQARDTRSTQSQVIENVAADAENAESVVGEVAMMQCEAPRTHTIIEIDGGYQHQHMRRSVSMNHCVSIADFLRVDQENNDHVEECYGDGATAGSSKQQEEEVSSKSSQKRRIGSMKRSVSSGRLLLARNGWRVRDTITPV